MRAIKTGNIYRIYDNSMETFNELPPVAYQIGFDQQTGFYIEGYSDIKLNEKVYGVHQEKVDKVLSAFHNFNRNLGIILSGDKGIGKSLFSKMLATEAMKQGYPLIIVNRYIPGIATYINSIEQEVVVLFDEFDKTFGNGKRDDDTRSNPQTEMLTLFDGIAQGKKLFIITCNEMRNLNEFLINRPGRFHYHINFDYPSPEDIRNYLEDILEEKYWNQINPVILFSRKAKLNYDCLRAIAFELNNGLIFEEAIKDLNIMNINDEKFNVFLRFTDGSTLIRRQMYYNLFGNQELYVYFDETSNLCHFNDPIQIQFNPEDAIYNNITGKFYIPGELLKMTLNLEDETEEIQAKITNIYGNKTIESLEFLKIVDTNKYRYVL